MTKQTALDWYWDKIKSHFEHDGDLLETASFTFAIAKQKEREQIKDAYGAGHNDGCAYMYDGNQEFVNWEKYYNETYKGGDK